MKIIALEAENVKHIKAVSIKPDGSTVIIGGDNEQGKTSLLDSIQYALGGQACIPPKPIRTGQKKAHVILDLGDIQITRTFTEKGSKVVVKNKDGATFASPQAMLDKLVGELTFDPLEFSSMDPKKQAEVLKKLVGLDFDSVNKQYKDLFAERADVNREGKSCKAVVDGLTKYDDIPEEEVSVQALTNEYAEAVKNNQEVERLDDLMGRQLSELEILNEKTLALEQEVKKTAKQQKASKKIDAVKIRHAMNSAEETNRQIRSNVQYDSENAKLDNLRKKSVSLTAKLDAIAKKKDADLSSAKFPIKGLGIDEDGVTFKDLPFSQCSTGQRIKISVAIGLAMNPQLRVLLIREGSLLDSKNLAMVAKMADKADAQIWIERVSKGEECQIIIEDGEVQEAHLLVDQKAGE